LRRDARPLHFLQVKQKLLQRFRLSELITGFERSVELLSALLLEHLLVHIVHGVGGVGFIAFFLDIEVVHV
jgi:hypothetical protein